VNAGSLNGRRIVVTRPLPQAEALAQAIRAAGGEPLLLPAMEIHDVADARAVHAIAARLAEFDWAIFISPTAVSKGLARLREVRGATAWPERVRVAAIGRGTQRALGDAGFAGIVAPEGAADSEALLALAAFAHLAGARIVIFRGVGGREQLAEGLRSRGASVEYAECYVRAGPDAESVSLGERSVDAFTVSSGEGLANLVQMLDAPGRQRLRAAPLFVPHRRVADQAKALGARSVIVAGPADAEMMAALVAYFGRTR
jgi:uroporphyrinogen-III synthase